MMDDMNSLMLDDELLEGVSGGAGVTYGMEDDPLYEKFASFWNAEKGTGSGSGMDSRVEFMNAFRKWVGDGVPENIADWYRTISGNGAGKKG